ncbi:Uncharacterised protein [Pandoraea pulmonicola]|uniref:Uncharacterized protein n=1 Tax=Pandoraea pulmonicola TaxID=93221 RepID=A0AAJ4Z9Z9_PANPU|nr:Uncharacterised protein [Pandoraea pulmonicola]
MGNQAGDDLGEKTGDVAHDGLLGVISSFRWKQCRTGLAPWKLVQITAKRPGRGQTGKNLVK